MTPTRKLFFCFLLSSLFLACKPTPKVTVPSNDDTAPEAHLTLFFQGQSFVPDEDFEIRWKPSGGVSNSYLFQAAPGENDEYAPEDEIHLVGSGKDLESGVREIVFIVNYDVPCNEEGGQVFETFSTHSFYKTEGNWGTAVPVGEEASTELFESFDFNLGELLAAGEAICTIPTRIHIEVLAVNNDQDQNITGFAALSFPIIKADG